MTGRPAARAGTVFDSAPALADLMPWSVPGPRTGRDWVLAPDPGILAARWRRLASSPDRAALFRETRARTVDSAVPQLPGRSAPTTRLSREAGPCPDPVRIRHGAFDRLWLLPDHRLLDRARPELWRVADGAQLFAVVQPHTPDAPGPAVTFSAELPDAHRPRGTGRVLPAYRLPGGRDPNLAPGLTGHLQDRLGTPVTAQDVLAWTAALTAHPAAARDGARVPVPLTASPELWARGLALGRRVVWLHTFGERCADPADGRPPGRPRMPGGRRPFVRQALPAGLPREAGYDEEKEAVLLDEGRVAPVAPAAWAYTAGGVCVLRAWFARRAAPDAEPGTLEAVHTAEWPRAWTTELIDLATVLALLAELQGAQAALAEAVARGPVVTAAGLAAAGVLPAPAHRARPASVLAHEEEGPEGQFPLF